VASSLVPSGLVTSENVALSEASMFWTLLAKLPQTRSACA
jgi:hypothetical protein